MVVNKNSNCANTLIFSEEKRVLELRRERKAKKSRGGGVEAEEEEEDEEWTESDEEELEEEGDSRIMQAVPKTHLPGGQPLHKGKIEGTVVISFQLWKFEFLENKN